MDIRPAALQRGILLPRMLQEVRKSYLSVDVCNITTYILQQGGSVVHLGVRTGDRHRKGRGLHRHHQHPQRGRPGRAELPVPPPGPRPHQGQDRGLRAGTSLH